MDEFISVQVGLPCFTDVRIFPRGQYDDGACVERVVSSYLFEMLQHRQYLVVVRRVEEYCVPFDISCLKRFVG